MPDLDDIIALATLMNADDDPSEAVTHRLRGLSDNDCYLAIAASELLLCTLVCCFVTGLLRSRAALHAEILVLRLWLSLANAIFVICFIRTRDTTMRFARTSLCTRTHPSRVRCGQPAAWFRCRSWAGYTINMFEFEFSTRTRPRTFDIESDSEHRHRHVLVARV
jgi:hypothetical protein